MSLFLAMVKSRSELLEYYLDVFCRFRSCRWFTCARLRHVFGSAALNGFNSCTLIFQLTSSVPRILEGGKVGRLTPTATADPDCVTEPKLIPALDVGRRSTSRCTFKGQPERRGPCAPGTRVARRLARARSGRSPADAIRGVSEVAHSADPPRAARGADRSPTQTPLRLLT